MTVPLCLTLNQESDGTGELKAEVSVNGFSGTGSAWFNIEKITAFARVLTETYPLRSDEEYELKGGYWNSSESGKLDHINLGLRFYPIGSLGHIGCHVQLATWLESASVAPEYTVSVELRTSYEELRAFGTSLLALAQGEGNAALLSCSGA